MKAARPVGLDFGKGRTIPHDLHEKRAGHHVMLKKVRGWPAVSLDCIEVMTEEECLAEKGREQFI